MAHLVQRAVLSAYDDTAKASQGTAAVLILVLVKHGAALARLSRPDTTDNEASPLSYDMLLFLMDTMLHLLRYGVLYSGRGLLRSLPALLPQYPLL